MIEDAFGTGVDWAPAGRGTRQTLGRPVRLALVTWPAVVLVGATVAAAACLFSDCDCGMLTQAKETLVGYPSTVKSISYRPDGAMLSSVGIDGSIVIWELANPGDDCSPPEVSGLIRCAAFSPDSRLLATGDRRAPVALYDLATHDSRTLDDPARSSAGAACVAFAPDGATLAVGQQDGLITLWNVASGRKKSILGGHDDFVASLAFAADGATAASSGGDRSVRIWDLMTGRQRFAIKSHTSTYVALTFSPDGGLLVVGDQVSPVVRLWNTTTGAECAALRGPAGAVVSVAISADGTTLAAADFKGQITFWDLGTLTIRPKHLTHPGALALAFTPDGRSLATGGFDGTIHLWEIPRSPER
jgi:WD40 repeat protein